MGTNASGQPQSPMQFASTSSESTGLHQTVSQDSLSFMQSNYAPVRFALAENNAEKLKYAKETLLQFQGCQNTLTSLPLLADEGDRAGVANLQNAFSANLKKAEQLISLIESGKLSGQDTQAAFGLLQTSLDASKISLFLQLDLQLPKNGETKKVSVLDLDFPGKRKKVLQYSNSSTLASLVEDGAFEKGFVTEYFKWKADFLYQNALSFYEQNKSLCSPNALDGVKSAHKDASSAAFSQGKNAEKWCKENYSAINSLSEECMKFASRISQKIEREKTKTQKTPVFGGLISVPENFRQDALAWNKTVQVFSAMGIGIFGGFAGKAFEKTYFSAQAVSQIKEGDTLGGAIFLTALWSGPLAGSIRGAGMLPTIARASIGTAGAAAGGYILYGMAQGTILSSKDMQDFGFSSQGLATLVESGIFTAVGMRGAAEGLGKLPAGARAIAARGSSAGAKAIATRANEAAVAAKPRIYALSVALVADEGFADTVPIKTPKTKARTATSFERAGDASLNHGDFRGAIKHWNAALQRMPDGLSKQAFQSARSEQLVSAIEAVGSMGAELYESAAEMVISFNPQRASELLIKSADCSIGKYHVFGTDNPTSGRYERAFALLPPEQANRLRKATAEELLQKAKIGNSPYESCTYAIYANRILASLGSLSEFEMLAQEGDLALRISPGNPDWAIAKDLYARAARRIEDESQQQAFLFSKAELLVTTATGPDIYRESSVVGGFHTAAELISVSHPEIAAGLYMEAGKRYLGIRNHYLAAKNFFSAAELLKTTDAQHALQLYEQANELYLKGDVNGANCSEIAKSFFSAAELLKTTDAQRAAQLYEEAGKLYAKEGVYVANRAAIAKSFFSAAELLKTTDAQHAAELYGKAGGLYYQTNDSAADAFVLVECTRKFAGFLKTTEAQRATELYEYAASVEEALNWVAQAPKSIVELLANNAGNGCYARDAVTMFELERITPGAVATLASKYGINFFGRYSTETLSAMLEEKANPKPLLVVLYPMLDSNRAFYSNTEAIDSLRKNFNVQIIEAGDTRAAAKRLFAINKKYGKISALLLGGHGAKLTVTLGNGQDGQLAADKFIAGANVSRFFIEKPAIVLVSCSTGARGGIAHRASKKYGNMLITAPSMSTEFKSIELLRMEGETPIFSVKYSRGGSRMYLTGTKIPKTPVE